jgi:ABC-type transport system substrate-binding protein
MLKSLNKGFVLLLVLSICLSSTPIPTSNAAAIAKGPQSFTVNPHFGEPEGAALSAQTEASPATLVGEDETKREHTSKEFVFSDNSRMLVMYPQAVHYEENGKLEEIDNTLVHSSEGAGKTFITNNANAFKVKLPETLNKNNAVSVEKDGYQLSIKWQDALRSPFYRGKRKRCRSNPQRPYFH